MTAVVWPEPRLDGGAGFLATLQTRNRFMSINLAALRKDLNTFLKDERQFGSRALITVKNDRCSPRSKSFLFFFRISACYKHTLQIY